MIQHEEGNQKWQACTEPFFPYLDINTDIDPSVVSKKLMSTKFEDVISILPNVFMKDGHMTPQHHARKFTFKKHGLRFNIPIKFEKVFKMENQEDLRKLSAIFNIDLSVKSNNTSNIKEEIKWSTQSDKTIENIYDKDFKYYNYKKKSKI